MIIKFNVSNFLSFKEPVTLNMISTSYTELPTHKTKTGLKEPNYLLRGAAIYGGNASGKTNLINALEFMRNLIVRGTYGKQAIWVEPFLLSSKCLKKPSNFDINILIDGTIYNYGFLVDKKKVHEEWLFKIEGSTETRMFERITNTEDETIVEHDYLVADKESEDIVRLVSKTTRPNQLFINEAYEKNIESIEPVMNWFEEKLEIIPANSQYQNLTSRATEENDFINFISNFVNRVDTGIKEIIPKKEEIDIDSEFSELPVKLKEDLKDNLEGGEKGAIIGTESSQKIIFKEKGNFFKVTLKMVHHSEEIDNPVEFDFQQESDGTQRLMHLLPILVDLREQEKVVLIDELDRRMHPKLTIAFLESFYKITSKTSKGQIIFTTHDTNLLDLDIVRRDEVWFFNKMDNGQSELNSLAEYNVRKDKKIDKGYLQGRFGGLPFIKEEI